MKREPIIHAAGVLWQLTLRELRVRYKQSLLGVAWAFFVPLALLITLSLVFSRWTRIADALEPGMPYPLFVGIGLVPWLFHAQSLGQATNSLVANRNLVTKIYFAREVFPFSSVLCALFDALMAIPVVVALCWWYGSGSPDSSLFLGNPAASPILSSPAALPLLNNPASLTFWSNPAAPFLLLGVIFIQVLLTTGLALALSCLNLFYRDVKHILPMGLQVWMLSTNVMFPLTASTPEAAAWSYINPMIPILSAYRSIITQGTITEGHSFACAAVISLSVFISGWTCFRAAEPRFAEAI